MSMHHRIWLLLSVTGFVVAQIPLNQTGNATTPTIVAPTISRPLRSIPRRPLENGRRVPQFRTAPSERRPVPSQAERLRSSNSPFKDSSASESDFGSSGSEESESRPKRNFFASKPSAAPSTTVSTAGSGVESTPNATQTMESAPASEEEPIPESDPASEEEPNPDDFDDGDFPWKLLEKKLSE